MCPRCRYAASGRRCPALKRRYASWAVYPMLTWLGCCANSRESSSGARCQAQDGKAGLSSTRPFRTQPVLWRALSHGRQDAQGTEREQMPCRPCRSPSAKPFGRLFRRAWHPGKSRSTLACRLRLCARCSRAPRRAGRTGRPATLVRHTMPKPRVTQRQMTCPAP
jgi:hypothetical protein